MVKDTTYYEILQVEYTATDVELKKAYRKQAIKLHPDKNGNDPEAAAKFQELGEAYGILLNKELRALYDEVGIDGLKDNQLADQADIDPAEFFKMIFGGDSFKDWIGELSMMTDMEQTAEILREDEEVDETSSKMTDLSVKDNSKTDVSGSGKSDTPYTDLSAEANKKKKSKITPEQRERLAAFLEDSRIKKEQRVDDISAKLIEKIKQYQDSAANPDALENFRRKLRIEFEDLKVESFGIQLLHLIAKAYLDQAHATIAASKTFGVSKIFTSVKSKSGRVKGGFLIVKTAVDAQIAAQDMMKQQAILEQLGQELTDEQKYKQAEAERIITGKLLATAWATTKYEVNGVLNKVSRKVLNDKSLSKKERISRAEAVVFIGKEMLNTQRSADEDEEARIFEEMMAEASAKKSKHPKTKVNEQHFEAMYGEEEQETEIPTK